MTSLSVEPTNVKYKIGDIVLVKITSFPWWPCKIDEVFPNLADPYTVLFLNDNKHAYIKECQIRPFSTCIPPQSKKKLKRVNKQLIGAYEEARKVLKIENNPPSEVEDHIKKEVDLPNSYPNIQVNFKRNFCVKRNRNTSRNAFNRKNCETIYEERKEDDESEESGDSKNENGILNKKGVKKFKEEEPQESISIFDHEREIQSENPTKLELDPIFMDNSLSLKNEIEKYSDCIKNIKELLNQIIRSLFNGDFKHYLKLQENKYSLIKLLEQLKTISSLQYDISEYFDFFLDSLGEEVGFIVTIDNSNRAYTIKKIKAFIKYIKEDIPTCKDPRALPFNSLFNFLRSLINKSFADNILNNKYKLNSLDYFYNEVIQGNFIEEANEELTQKLLQNNFQTKGEDNIKKFKLILTSTVIFLN